MAIIWCMIYHHMNILQYIYRSYLNLSLDDIYGRTLNRIIKPDISMHFSLGTEYDYCKYNNYCKSNSMCLYKLWGRKTGFDVILPWSQKLQRI